MRRPIAWIFFAALSYLLVASLLSRWVHLPMAGDVGFTLVFTGFSVSHAVATLGGKRAGLFFAISAGVSWLFEHFGVATGAIYGPYHYSDMLGFKLGQVPVLIPLAWFMVIYPAWEVAGFLLEGIVAPPGAVLAVRALVAAMVATMWDLVMDPGMAAAGNWVWETGGPYFGVPLHNYAGWILTTFTVYIISGAALGLGRFGSATGPSTLFRSLPLAVYALLASTYLTPRRLETLEPLRLVAAFTMGFASVVAACRLLLGSSQTPARR